MDLVRGTLCPALKSIFEHGLKKPSLLGGPGHPWLFIEEVRVGHGSQEGSEEGLGVVPWADLPLPLTQHRLPAEKWREISILSTLVLFSVKLTGNGSSFRLPFPYSAQPGRGFRVPFPCQYPTSPPAGLTLWPSPG